MQMKWRKKLAAAQSAASDKIAAAEHSLDSEKRAHKNKLELVQAAKLDLQTALDDMQRRHARLSDNHSSACSENQSLKV